MRHNKINPKCQEVVAATFMVALSSGVSRRHKACGYQKTNLGIRAFTLMEILCAIFIVAILVTILSVVFNMAIKSYRQASDIVEIATKAQRFLGQITTELQGAIVSQNPSISFQGSASNIYFMAPCENSSPVELCEVGYNLVVTDLRKHFVTYGASGFEYPTSAVNYITGGENLYIDEVNSLVFSYIDTSPGSPFSTWNSNTNLPQQVEITIMMQDTRNVTYRFTTRVFIPGSTNNP